MGGRIIAIGDIHGHSDALASLVRLINPQPDDTLVFLGDYIDRGPDSKGVLNQLIELADRCRLVPLKGNHEEMMLGAREGRSDFKFWMTFGGDFALESYGPDQSLRLVPRQHWAFLVFSDYLTLVTQRPLRSIREVVAFLDADPAKEVCRWLNENGGHAVVEEYRKMVSGSERSSEVLAGKEQA